MRENLQAVGTGMATTNVADGKVTTFESGTVLAEAVAGWLLRLALAAPGDFRLCLSGGSTPKSLYQRLAEPPFKDQFPWSRTKLFFGDERFVPATDKDSNFKMVSDALLSRIEIPSNNVFRIDTDAPSPTMAAEHYDATLRRIYGANSLDPHRPLFDVTFLGLGPDGHTASLLPGQPVLEERERWVDEVAKGRPEARITLTYPPLESSRVIAFLVVGGDKRAMMAHVRGGATDVPAGRLDTRADVHWFTDRAAAGSGLDASSHEP